MVALVICGLHGCSFLERFDAANSPANPVDDIVGVSVPLGWAANLALAAHSGQDLDCTSIVDHCEGFACLERVLIEIGDACPLPLLEGGEGSISVWGTWLDDDLALLNFDFSDARAGGRSLIRDRLLGAVASQSEHWVDLQWAWQGVDVDDLGLETEQSLWSVSVERVAQGAEPQSDILHLSGLSQLADVQLGPDRELGAAQVSLAAAVFSPECGLNPISGEAAWHQFGTDEIGLQVVSFHSECDGLADTAGLYWGGLELELVR